MHHCHMEKGLCPIVKSRLKLQHLGSDKYVLTLSVVRTASCWLYSKSLGVSKGVKGLVPLQEG